MPRGELHKVGGRQAREALEHGWVKVDRATAGRLYAAGVAITVAGGRVNPAHLDRLGVVLDPNELRAPFDRLITRVQAELDARPFLSYRSADGDKAVAYFVAENVWPTMPRSARGRMPSSEEPRELTREMRGAEWLQSCGAGEPGVLDRQKHRPLGASQRSADRAPPSRMLSEHTARARRSR